MQFKELNVIPAILKALEKEHYEVPTPIQEEAIPIILSGRDLLGCAQTGTGKTAAFAIPTLQLLWEERTTSASGQNIRALVVTPTRELALQVYESFCTYGKYTSLKCCAVFGGVSQKPQEEILKQRVDILVATPGRLNDLISQRIIDISRIRILILDEADRMLDMGFINDVKKIIAKTPLQRQTLLFSATMPEDIARLSETILKTPAKIAITPVSSTVDTIEQFLYYVDKNNKKDLLLHILKDKKIESVLVFTRTKHGADRIVKQLARENVAAMAIHGDKSQGARQNALSNFKNKKLRILIATDIAARGIDIDELSHVINYDLPNTPETYVHRIGRTGRAGLGGIAISFCDFDEKEQLVQIENLIGKKLTEVQEHPYPLMNDFPAVKPIQQRKETKTVQPQKSLSKETSSKPNTSSGNITHPSAPKQMSAPGQSKTHKQSTAQGQSTVPRQSVPKQSAPKQSTAPSYAGQITASLKEKEAPKKKFRMTADGTLKEKKSFHKNFFFRKHK